MCFVACRRHFSCLASLVTVLIALPVYAQTPTPTPSAPPDAAPAEKAKVTLLSQPCLGWNFQSGISVYNPETDRELFILTHADEIGGAGIVFIHPQSNVSQIKQIPDTAGAWAIAPMDQHRIAVGTYFDGDIHIFNMQEWAFEDPVDVPGESYVWNLVKAPDGRLYGGTFPGGRLIALHPETLELEDCGQAAPPNRFVYRVSVLPDGRLLCHVGAEAPGTRIYDPATKTFLEPPPAFAHVTEGISWNGYFVTAHAFFDAQLNKLDAPPFPLPDPAIETWQIELAPSTHERLFLRQGFAVYQVNAVDSRPQLVFDFDLQGGTLTASGKGGSLFGFRGQHYFVIRPGDAAFDRQGIRAASPPRRPMFLRIDNAKRVWGAAPSGQTIFFASRDTGVFVSSGSVTPVPGRVHEMGFVENVAYGVSSGRGDIFVFHIDDPWDEFSGRNPRILYSAAEAGYVTPTGGLRVGYADHLYTGWTAPDKPGGAVILTHFHTGRSRVFEDPLGPQGISGMALSATYLFLGTTIEREGRAETAPGAPQFAVLGADTMQPYWNQAFEGAVTVDRLSHHMNTGLVLLVVDNLLRVFDPNAMKLLPPFPAETPPVTSLSLAQRFDGYVYYGSGNLLVRVNVRTGESQTVAEMPMEIGPVAAIFGGELFAACGVNLYRINLPESMSAHDPLPGMPAPVLQ